MASQLHGANRTSLAAFMATDVERMGKALAGLRDASSYATGAVLEQSRPRPPPPLPHSTHCCTTPWLTRHDLPAPTARRADRDPAFSLAAKTPTTRSPTHTDPGWHCDSSTSSCAHATRDDSTQSEATHGCGHSHPKGSRSWTPATMSRSSASGSDWGPRPRALWGVAGRRGEPRMLFAASWPTARPAATASSGYWRTNCRPWTRSPRSSRPGSYQAPSSALRMSSQGRPEGSPPSTWYRFAGAVGAGDDPTETMRLRGRAAQEKQKNMRAMCVCVCVSTDHPGPASPNTVSWRRSILPIGGKFG